MASELLRTGDLHSLGFRLRSHPQQTAPIPLRHPINTEVGKAAQPIIERVPLNWPKHALDPTGLRG